MQNAFDERLARQIRSDPRLIRVALDDEPAGVTMLADAGEESYARRGALSPSFAPSEPAAGELSEFGEGVSSAIGGRALERGRPGGEVLP
ncbi:MAG: hypothetical protein ACR2GQ_05000, partial [Gemmatimonadota bacterium]